MYSAAFLHTGPQNPVSPDPQGKEGSNPIHQRRGLTCNVGQKKQRSAVGLKLNHTSRDVYRKTAYAHDRCARNSLFLAPAPFFGIDTGALR
jgi:hypothetical protein